VSEQIETQFIFENAIVNVHFADLTEDKSRRRTKAIHKAAENLMKSYKGGLKSGINPNTN